MQGAYIMLGSTVSPALVGYLLIFVCLFVCWFLMINDMHHRNRSTLIPGVIRLAECICVLVVVPSTDGPRENRWTKY